MTTPFWINQPSILIDPKYLFDMWPKEKMAYNQKLNSISRLIILITILGTIIFRSLRMFITGIITLGIIIFLFYIQNNKNKKQKENFDTMNIINKNFQTPQPINPLMNVYLDNPERKPAAPAFNPIVEQNINKDTQDFVVQSFEPENKTAEECIKARLFQDLGDNFLFDKSMRNFYSTPNTTIPNDQKAFAEFCYGDMTSCKEGDPIACSRWDPRYIDGNQ
jgi:hypothetical protein